MDQHPWGEPPPYDGWIDDILFWVIIGTLLVYFAAFVVYTTFYILGFVYRVLLSIASYIEFEPWIRSSQRGAESLEAWIKSWLDALLALIRRGYFSIIRLVFSVLMWIFKAVWVIVSLAIVAGLVWFVGSMLGLTTQTPASLYARFLQVTQTLNFATVARATQGVRIRGREWFRSLPARVISLVLVSMLFWVLLFVNLVLPIWMFEKGYFSIVIGVSMVLWWEATKMITAYHEDLQIEPEQVQPGQVQPGQVQPEQVQQPPQRHLQPDFQDDLEVPDVPPPAYNDDVRPPHYLYADYLNHPLPNADDDDGDPFIDPRSPPPRFREEAVPAPRNRLMVEGGIGQRSIARGVDLISFFDRHLQDDIRERVATQNQLVIVARRILYYIPDDELIRCTVDEAYRIQRIEEIVGFCSRVYDERIWNEPRYSGQMQELILMHEEWDREYHEANSPNGVRRRR
jgi:uncharacterized membrane protein YvlD (DUF360 family)